MALTDRKQTVLNLAAKIISYGTTFLISFFLTPYLVNKLGKEIYSFYPLANNFVSYMGIVTVALNGMASRFITIEVTKNEKRNVNEYISTVFFSNILMSVVLAIFMCAAVKYLEYLIQIPVESIIAVKILFSLVFISMLVNLFTSVFGVAVYATNKLIYGSIIEILVSISRVLLYIILFAVFTPSIIFVGIVSLVIALMTCGLQMICTKKLLPYVKLSKKYYDRLKVKVLVSSGVWNSINQLGDLLLGGIGILLANVLLGPGEAGDYSLALSIPHFVSGLVSAMTAVFLPRMVKSFALNNENEMIIITQNAQKFLGLVMNIPIAVFMAVGQNFYKLWVPSADPIKLQILTVLIIGESIITAVNWPVTNLNIVMNKVKIPALVLVGAGIINTIGAILLCKYTKLGVYSIVIIHCVVSLSYFGIFTVAYVCKNLRVAYRTFAIQMLQSLVGAVCIFLSSFVINQFFSVTDWIKLFMECIVCGIIGLMVNSLILLKPTGIYEIYNKYVRIRKRDI